MANEPIRILVTGEQDDLEARFPAELGFRGTPLEWVAVPVLKFERLPVDADQISKLLENPAEWIIFTSPRGVRFWSDLLMEHGQQAPVEVRVACIGQKTAEVAHQEGFTPDFVPLQPGSEGFLESFLKLLKDASVKPSVFIPTAEGGRTMIREALEEFGCKVETLPIYRSVPRPDLHESLSQAELGEARAILFTSPSSVDAFIRVFTIPEGIQIFSIGKFTGDHLRRVGFQDTRTLPQGDFERIGEIL